MKKVLLFFTSLFIGIGLLVWIFNFLGWKEIKSAFLIFSGWHGIVILLLSVLMLLIGMWKWKIILKSQGYDLSSKKLISPYFAGFFLTYLFPIIFFGGELFRGYVLRDRFSIPWKNAISSVIIERILEITAFLITVFLGVIFFLIKIGLPPVNLCIIFAVTLFISTVLIGFFYFKVLRKESLAGFFVKFFNGKKEPLEVEKEIFRFFKFNKKVLWQGIGLAFLRVFVTGVRCWVLLLFLGKTVAFFSIFSILGFYYFSLMIPIPAALGSHDIIQIFAFNSLGIGASLAPAFTMIQRGAELFLALVGGVLFLRLGASLIHAVLFKKIGGLMDK
ncbi:MAG: lysylphosphatidylglycerol synthase transmembrane domain-containing protein [Candidatus Nealsonbacteria bacterium]